MPARGADASEFVFVSFSLTTYIISRYIICFLVFNDACAIRTGGIFLWRLSPLANLIRTEEKDRDNSRTRCKLGIIDIP